MTLSDERFGYVSLVRPGHFNCNVSSPPTEEEGWFHLVVIYRPSSEESEVYFNGTRGVTTNCGNGPKKRDPPPLGQPLCIGGNREERHLYNAGVAFREVRVYDRALSEAEVQRLYMFSGASRNAAAAHPHT